MTPTCTVMVGLPASGKSTRIDNLLFGYGAVDRPYVYSTDNILERIAKQLGKTYNGVFDAHIKSAQLEADIMLADAIKHKMNIIWDQTNLAVGKRRKVLNRMKQAGYVVECECIEPPATDDDYAEWKKRLAGRPGKNIPDEIIERMMDTYVKPSLDEGFDAVAIFDLYGNLVSEERV